MAGPVPRILVLGLGNDVLTDDAVGLRVAAAVRETLSNEPEVEVRATTEMGLALLDEMEGREGLVLVDSVQTGNAPPGQIHEFSAAQVRESKGPRTPHFVGVGDALALGGLLGLKMPREVAVFAIEVADPFTLGTSLTPGVAGAVAPAAVRVAARAREFLARPAPVFGPQ